MKINRRKFLSFAGGAAAIGIAAKTTHSAAADNAAREAQNAAHAGKRWGMIIDLRKCREQGKGCTKCIDACHLSHNVPEIHDPKDEMKWIWKEPYKHAFIEQENERLPEAVSGIPVVLMCNHCDNPPCVSVCPTKATWKRSDGIIMMDWHRCIGCRYCMAACPYGSRSFNWKDPRPHIKDIHDEFPTRMRGVVEKCTFCDERLARGQMPACSLACPANALVFGDLDDENSEIRKILAENFTIRRKPELGTNPEIYYIV